MPERLDQANANPLVSMCRNPGPGTPLAGRHLTRHGLRRCLVDECICPYVGATGPPAPQKRQVQAEPVKPGLAPAGPPTTVSRSTTKISVEPAGINGEGDCLP